MAAAAAARAACSALSKTLNPTKPLQNKTGRFAQWWLQNDPPIPAPQRPACPLTPKPQNRASLHPKPLKPHASANPKTRLPTAPSLPANPKTRLHAHQKNLSVPLASSALFSSRLSFFPPAPLPALSIAGWSKMATMSCVPRSALVRGMCPLTASRL